ncbi:MAG TPA: hypothetical protein VLW55_01480 [Burkholderiaceae bacterium]|nr:hypothetical protein [Burkholderiaceae bacterium]
MNTEAMDSVGELRHVKDQATDAIANEVLNFAEIAKAWWQRNAELVRDTAGAARDQAVAFGSRTRLYVKDEPVKSVVLAAAAGAALTALLMFLAKRPR